MTKKFITKCVLKGIVLSYPNLFKQRTVNGNGIPKYGTTIIVDKSDVESLDKMYAAINSAAESGGFTDNASLKSPINDGDVLHPGELLYKNSKYFYASSIIAPTVVDHKLQEIKFRSDEPQSGTIANVSLDFTPYNYNGKCGVAATLINVQLLPKNKLSDLRSRPEDDFGPETDYE